MLGFRSMLAISVAPLIGVALIACDSQTSQSTPTVADETALTETVVSPEIAILAHRLVFAYMSDKPWGFFGATCEKWIEGDYLWDASMSELRPDGRIKITYQRKEDRIVGPEKLVFYVNIDAGEVEGDNKPENDTGRMGAAEGCDQW